MRHPLLLWMIVALAGLAVGCFDSHCPEGTPESECSAPGGGGGDGDDDDDDDDDDDGDSVREVCLETCEKTAECLGVAGGDCETSCAGPGVGFMTCSNEEEIFDAFGRCNAGECGPMGSTYSRCLSGVPRCK